MCFEKDDKMHHFTSCHHSRPHSSSERWGLKLLPRCLSSSGLGVVGIPLLSNASPQLLSVLSVQSLIPGVIIAGGCTELAALLGGAFLVTSSLGSGGPHRITVLRTGVGNAVVWNGRLAKGCSLTDGHGLLGVGVGVGCLGVDGVKSCNKQDQHRHSNKSLHIYILLILLSLENPKMKPAAVGLLSVNNSKLSNL